MKDLEKVLLLACKFLSAGCWLLKVEGRLVLLGLAKEARLHLLRDCQGRLHNLYYFFWIVRALAYERRE